MELIKQEAEAVIIRFGSKKLALVHISSQLEYINKLINYIEIHGAHKSLSVLLRFDFEWLERLRTTINENK